MVLAWEMDRGRLRCACAAGLRSWPELGVRNGALSSLSSVIGPDDNDDCSSPACRCCCSTSECGESPEEIWVWIGCGPPRCRVLRDGRVGYGGGGSAIALLSQRSSSLTVGGGGRASGAVAVGVVVVGSMGDEEPQCRRARRRGDCEGRIDTVGGSGSIHRPALKLSRAAVRGPLQLWAPVFLCLDLDYHRGNTCLEPRFRLTLPSYNDFILSRETPR